MLAKIAVYVHALCGRIKRMLTRFGIGWIAEIAIRALCVVTGCEAVDGWMDALAVLLLPTLQDGLVMLIHHWLRPGISPRLRAKRDRNKVRGLRRRNLRSRGDRKR
ncbi:hypothetical protein [Streptomyces sp. MMBL 11-3]|uniref:hypothetical protein n=1 Tax=Streptomyces sp. MMBL 11-3 TaxID=3382639 RepID=UPI0039B54B45